MSIQQIIIWIAAIATAFLCGSVMFSRIIPRLFKKVDICKISPDNNPGAANVFTYCGVKFGIVCLALDMAKGFLPVYTIYRIIGSDSLLFALIITAPVLGHAVAPFDRCRGGKCIATVFGVLLALLPVSGIVFVLAGLYIFFSTVIKIRPNSKRSIVTFILFALISSILLAAHGKIPLAAGCFAISSIAVFKHLKVPENIEAQVAVKC